LVVRVVVETRLFHLLLLLLPWRLIPVLLLHRALSVAARALVRVRMRLVGSRRVQLRVAAHTGPVRARTAAGAADEVRRQVRPESA
jgi:hypothetical protein